jgi:hypothetical protein
MYISIPIIPPGPSPSDFPSIPWGLLAPDKGTFQLNHALCNTALYRPTYPAGEDQVNEKKLESLEGETKEEELPKERVFMMKKFGKSVGVTTLKIGWKSAHVIQPFDELKFMDSERKLRIEQIRKCNAKPENALQIFEGLAAVLRDNLMDY